MNVVFIYRCECGRYLARDLSDDPNKPCECGSTSYVLKSTVDAKVVLERVANEFADLIGARILGEYGKQA